MTKLTEQQTTVLNSPISLGCKAYLWEIAANAMMSREKVSKTLAELAALPDPPVKMISDDCGAETRWKSNMTAGNHDR